MKSNLKNIVINNKIQTQITSYIHKKIERSEVNVNEKSKEKIQVRSEQPKGQKVQSKLKRTETQVLSDISAKQSVQNHLEQPKKSKINVSFYLNKTPSLPAGEYIDKMHELWYRNYEKLQRDHAFIQWIFPNSFQSRFNIYAKPLSSQQARQFKTNPQIYLRYLKSYDMMLAFYGMKIKDKRTGELTRSRNPDYQERFHKTLITSFHNHMRITRILCSLNQTGFGRYAAELCKFLKYEIYSSNGRLNLLQKYNVYNDWKPHEIYVQTPQNINQFFTKYLKEKIVINVENVKTEKQEEKNETKKIETLNEQKKS